MRTGSADRDGSAASTSEARKRNHYARMGQVSFDERSCKLATLAVESLGRLGNESSDLIDQADRSGNGKHSGRNGRIVLIAERRLQGTPIPNHACDHSGRDFAQSSSIPGVDQF